MFPKISLTYVISMFRSILPILMCFSLIVSGCQMILPPGPSTPTPLPTSTPAGRLATPTPTPAPALVPSGPITLTVWLPDSLVPLTNVQTNGVLSQQLAAFVATRTDIRVQTQTKLALGTGSLLELIQTAAPVAPSYLPDVALLDLADVPAAAQAGLLRPLNDLVPADVLTNLFPFAQIGRADDQWVAVAYVTDMEHLAYNSIRVSSPPITWAQALPDIQPLLFPAGISNGMVSDALLAQYAAAGGGWLDDSGQPALSTTALTLMLRQLQDAERAGWISTNSLNFSSADDTWTAYLGSPTQMVVVRASRFISPRVFASVTSPAPLPGPNEPARPIARGWALVVPTRDPERISAAASLVAWLASPENEAILARAANLLPSRRAAFDYWYPTEPYTAFARQELERAISPPPPQAVQVIGPAIQKAVSDVLSGRLQPADAATAAAAIVGHAPR
jgi:ABC-type glycerol-3-phosphate transport system substrate-binding protein